MTLKKLKLDQQNDEKEIGNSYYRDHTNYWEQRVQGRTMMKKVWFFDLEILQPTNQ